MKLIEAAALARVIPKDGFVGCEWVHKQIEDAAPVKHEHGAWTEENLWTLTMVRCSECGAMYPKDYAWNRKTLEYWKYCPECGANMESEEYEDAGL